MSHNFYDRKSTWISVSIFSIYTSIIVCTYILNSLRAFRYCSLFLISPLLYNSSIKLLASVRVSLCPDNLSQVGLQVWCKYQLC